MFDHRSAIVVWRVEPWRQTPYPQGLRNKGERMASLPTQLHGSRPVDPGQRLDPAMHLIPRDGAGNEAARSEEDEHWMRLALHEAKQASLEGEVPVGAVVVFRGSLLATGRNQSIRMHDPSAHAEVLALREAARRIANYRLKGCVLYTTLEPCAMCAGALLHARLDRVVFGCRDPKTGAAGSVVDLFADPRLNHQTRVSAEVLEASCAEVLQGFFRERRKSRQAQSLETQAGDQSAATALSPSPADRTEVFAPGAAQDPA